MIKFSAVLNFTLCTLLFYVSNAQADRGCTVTQNTFNMPISLSVAQDHPINTPIGAAGTYDLYSCSDTSQFNQAITISSYDSTGKRINGRLIFNSGIKGIGYSVGMKSIGNCDGKIDYAGRESNNWPYTVLCRAKGLFPVQPIKGQFLLTFYKIAPTTDSGTVASKTSITAPLYNNDGWWTSPESKLTITGLTVTTVSCSMPNVTVPMGKTNTLQMFDGVGSRLSPVPFEIRLNNCIAGPNTSVKYQFDPLKPALDSKNGILALDSGGAKPAATGVGIQIRSADGNEAVQEFGVPHAFGNITTGGSYTIPFNARYIQTAAKVAAGIANSAMTFTLIYE
ncbi:fimbrial protein [Solimicrobium silvestre]|uniref:Fimbrial protein n=1 Tax=Solimicrobium silvestre TaxID=2099400 RepID=A0A2S9H1C0_9BURK|nr:fimbrial protein [Solimicrobium silvestre]PRC93779.1 Fimbrial protein [Solimicrobium silvestre]